MRLYRSSSKSLKTICSELGISLETLRHWVNQSKIEGAPSEP